ncbi:MAG: asparagine--tRNA ligase [Bacilli bacterium]|jgi:asparaginyl-tRNA synthetase|nr:asparagine--tRNA ligase [Bacilli bacterium]
MYLKEIMDEAKKYVGKEVSVSGWVRNHRRQKELGFIVFSDGTQFNQLQLIYDNQLSCFEELAALKIGTAIEVRGILQESAGSGQDYELAIQDFKLLGDCPDDYPLQPKPHSPEFLRSIAYLRPRSNLFQAVFRIRSLAAMAIHTYFQDRGYVYLHAPLITASDCEGAGEMFQVTTLPLEQLNGKVDYTKDFFHKKTGLTVSGQLQAETFAMAFSKVYTFGPTFRAEDSNTKTHVAEFWMIEPEIAFCDLDGVMDIEEDMLKFIVQYILEKAHDELVFLDKFAEKGLLQKLEKLVSSTFTRITHEEVISILKKADVRWEFEPKYGEDIAKEHEKYITEYFDGPVFITNWPKEIKSFYMKQNEDGTVRGVDLEVPGIGELIGGSEREADYEKLRTRMEELKMDISEMEWYLNLRKYGSCVHSGFGLGFERLLLYLTGVDNIRDVIAYPRTPGNCEF